MSKMIEELVYSFAIRQFHKAPINTERDLMCVCNDFANEFLAQPLSSRLTAEEKFMVRRLHGEFKRLYTENKHSIFRWSEGYQGKYELLESIFGADFFKEGE